MYVGDLSSSFSFDLLLIFIDSRDFVHFWLVLEIWKKGGREIEMWSRLLFVIMMFYANPVSMILSCSLLWTLPYPTAGLAIVFRPTYSHLFPSPLFNSGQSTLVAV